MKASYEYGWYVPAGGRGHRLHPLTAHLPKPLLPVRVGEGTHTIERIIDYPLSLAIKYGGKIAVSSCYMGDLVNKHVYDNYSGYGIATLNGEDPDAAPAGALGLAMETGVYDSNRIIFLPSDAYILPRTLSGFLRSSLENKSDVTMLVSTNLEGNDLVRVNPSGYVVGGEGQALGILGVYALSTSWLTRRLEQLGALGDYDIRTDIVLPENVPAGKIHTYVADGPWKFRDLGTVSSYGEFVMRENSASRVCFEPSNVFEGIDNIIAMPGSSVSAFPETVLQNSKVIANFNAVVNEVSVPLTVDSGWAIIE